MWSSFLGSGKLKPWMIYLEISCLRFGCVKLKLNAIYLPTPIPNK